MKYRITLLNTAALILILTELYGYVSVSLKGEENTYAPVALGISLMIGGLALMADLFLQRTVKSYIRINLLGAIPLLLFMLFYAYNTRKKTIVLPQGASHSFTLVYNVKNAPPLFRGKPVFGGTTESDRADILYTATPLEKDLWNTVFKVRSGKGKPVPIKASDLKVGEYDCNGRLWKYRIWRLAPVGAEKVKDRKMKAAEVQTMEARVRRRIAAYCNEH